MPHRVTRREPHLQESHEDVPHVAIPRVGALQLDGVLLLLLGQEGPRRDATERQGTLSDATDLKSCLRRSV